MNEIVKILKERLNKNEIKTKEDFKHELREITQELVLAGLSSTGFFDKAVFQGGTSLRLIHKIERYSEDLDFTMEKSDKDFKWEPYLDKVREYVGQYGCYLETVDKSKSDSNVKKAFVKDNSIEQMMDMSWTQKSGTPEKVKIKVEIDTNPPEYSRSEIKTYDFPCKFDVKINDLNSLFAGKCHALLCREYDKGRDWYDLKWFINNELEPNYKYLDNMLNQTGPWEGLKIKSDKLWVSKELLNKNEIINFIKINDDIDNFTNSESKIILDKNIIKDIINNFNKSDYGQNISKKSLINKY
jgi:predicted nucleotidyltransferase component of viral defense system